MATPVIQAGVDGGTNGVLVRNVTIDLGSTADRALWAQFVDATNGSASLTACTLDGVSVLADVVGPTVVNGMNLYNLHHVTTLTGSKVLEATWDATGFKSIVAMSFHTADQTAPFSSRQTTGSGSSSTLTATVTSATGELVVMAAQEGNGATLTPGSGSSTVAGISGSFRHGLQEAGASSVTIGGTWSASTNFWASAVSVKGSGGGGGGSTLLAKLNHFLRG